MLWDLGESDAYFFIKLKGLLQLTFAPLAIRSSDCLGSLSPKKKNELRSVRLLGGGNLFIHNVVV